MIQYELAPRYMLPRSKHRNPAGWDAATNKGLRCAPNTPITERMVALPAQGGDTGSWGADLSNWLTASHNVRNLYPILPTLR